jgi:RHS repeat-associated protein
VSQPGYKQTAPPGGTFSPNVQSGQVVAGLDFGNQSLNAPPPRPPAFTSTAPALAVVGQRYRYDATVSNPDGVTLQFDLPEKPDGMAVDPQTGVVVWDAAASQVGPQDVILRLQDSRGEVVLQKFKVTVTLDSPPVITSTPPEPAQSGLSYQYQVTAQDAENDPLTYALAKGPSGMTIDSSTGLVSWVGAPIGPGLPAGYAVSITVSDGRGGQDAQSFTLFVTASSPTLPPQSFTAQPPTSITLGHDYLYAVQTTFPAGDPLTYTLVTAPAGMTVDASGMVHWTPDAGQFGLNPVVLRVDDGTRGSAQESFTVNVVAQATGQPPAINPTTTPPAAAVAGQPYVYNPTATSPDGTPLVWSLDTAPAGMSIDQSRGTIRWTPAAGQVGSQDVVVRVTTSEGKSDTQNFTVTVRGANTPPLITSSPPTQGAVGQAYFYAVGASDVDGDPLTYSLTTAPAGMTIDPSTGLITWTPADAQAGTQAAALAVSDGQGGTVTQNWNVVVATAASAPDRPPMITSTTPPQTAAVGQLFQYTVTATDPDGPTPSFSLPNAPAGMTIDPVSGLVQWTPTAAQAGVARVTVAATDAQGAAALQSFSIAVTVNHPPAISSTPPASVTVGATYRYDVQATDPDGDPLTYALTTAPTGMTLDALGRLTWAPAAADIGTAQVGLTVADNHGALVSQSFAVTVAADTQAPKVNLQLSANPAKIGTDVTFVVTATDDVRVAALTLTVGGTPVALDMGGRAIVKLTAAGTVPVMATATDPSGNTGTASDSLVVVDPTVTNPPMASFDSPSDGDVLTMPTAVVGTVADAHLVSYTLSIAPAGSSSFKVIGSGTAPVSHGALGQLDPSMLANGSYDLRLDATNTGGRETIIDENVNVTGVLKLGDFTLSFTDLSVPVAGIPITLTRTYNTLQAGQSGDFGYGWRLGYGDTQLQTSVPKTGEEEELGLFNGFSYGSKVYVTLPGGKREMFTFEPAPAPGLIGGFLGIIYPKFVAEPGVTDTLSVDPADLRQFDDGTFGDWAGGYPYNPADPIFGGHYVLTTKAGLSYDIDAQSGNLNQVSDANHNVLHFTSGGIISDAGPKITFSRDAQGRITAATDPAGETIQYGYDAQGNLVSVTDRLGNTTQYVYNPAIPHYLDHVNDPLGHTGVRNQYDAQGRLVQLIGPAGTPIVLGYDMSSDVETVTDALGNPTTYQYDDRGNILTEVNPLGGITRRTFDASNNMLTETDPLGNTTTYTYDSKGDALTKTDPLGGVTRFTYGPRGQIATETDPLGDTITNQYDSAGNVTSSTDATGKTTRFTYDGSGNLLTLTDPEGGVTRYGYDAAGNPIKEIDPLGRETDRTYDALGHLLTESITVTTPSGPRVQTTKKTCDSDGRLASVTDAAGGTTSYTYNALGLVSAMTDPLGRQTQYRYDDAGRLIETIYADSSTTSATYDDKGRRTSSTDQAGQTTRYVYDAIDDLIATIYPDDTPDDSTDNPRISATYNIAGHITSRIDELGRVTKFQYDQDGRLVATILPDATPNDDTDNPRLTYAYDAAGRVIATVDPLGHRTSMVLDGVGRPTQVNYADGTHTSTTYDGVGRKLSEADESGATTHYVYDAAGNLTAVVDALGQRTTYAYDEVGDLVAQTDPNGHTTRYEYDADGRQTAQVLPLGQRSTTAYDSAGEVVSTTDAGGRTVTYTYDAVGRVATRHEPGSDVSFAYTPTGQVASVTDDRGVTTYTYDARQRLTRRTDPDGTSVRYTYDAAGEQTSVTTPAGTTRYTFDAQGRIATITGPDAALTRYSYDAAGNLIRVDLPDGTAEVRLYDPRNRLTSDQITGPPGLIAGYTYTLDATGARTAVVEASGRRVAYTYDALHRLTRESITDPSAGNRAVDYTYDAAGNRLTRADSVDGLTTYTYDSDDRLTAEMTGAATVNYTYDASGHLLTQADGAGDSTTYTWDTLGRLTHADVTTGGVTHHDDYRYDAAGRRVAVIADGVETRELLDDAPIYRVLEEYAPDGTVDASYVLGYGLISQARAGVASYYHTDGHGNVTFLTSPTGAVTDRYTYDAFGRLLSSSGTTPNEFLYSGEQYDRVLALYYLRSRYADTAIGRFLSPDPQPRTPQVPSTLNRYPYTRNNPVNRVDPRGTQDLGEELAALDIEAELATLEESSVAFVESVPDLIAEAFDSDAIGVFWQELGATTEGFAGDTVGLFEEAGIEVAETNVSVGGRIIDFVVKTPEGVKDLLMEVKYSLPTRAGGPLSRLAAQMTEMVANGGGRQAVVWTLRQPAAGALATVEEAVGSAVFNQVTFVHGVEGLAEFLASLI